MEYTKRGIIIDETGEIEETFITRDWNFRPKCQFCDRTMNQTDSIVPGYPHGGYKFKWWCETRDCADARHRRQQISAPERDIPDSVLVACGVPAGYAHCSFDNFKSRYDKQNRLFSAEKAIQYAESPDRIIFFNGNTGSGKTHLAVAILRRVIERGTTNAAFKKVPELIWDINNSYKKKEFDPENLSPEDTLNRYINSQFLVLDDLGAEKITDSTTMTLYMLIDGRISSLKPTIITSNLTIDEINDKIDARLASRLTSNVWTFSFSDYRKEKY